MKQEKWITGIICILVILGAGVLYWNHGQKTTGSGTVFATEMPSESAVAETTSDRSGSFLADQQDVQTEYAVYICGAVKHPGVYRFTQPARVCDVVEAAGGFTKSAAKTSVNQARYITDGEQIEILTRKQLLKSNMLKSNMLENNGQKSQEQIPGDTNQSTVQDSGKINLNTATEAELMTLSGVGQSKAKAITDYRTQNGLFGSIEEIMQVPGIKEGVFNQIKDSITV